MTQVLLAWAVHFFLEDGLGLDGLELGFEVLREVAGGGRVGATAWVGDVVTVVLELVALTAPGKIGLELVPSTNDSCVRVSCM